MPSAVEEHQGMEVDTEVGTTKLSKSQKRRRKKKLQKERLLASLESSAKREDSGNPENKSEVPLHTVVPNAQFSIRDSLITGYTTITTLDGESSVSKKRKRKKSKKKRPTLSDISNIHQDMGTAKSTDFKREEYRNISNGETGLSKTATCVVESSMLKKEGYMEVVNGERDSMGIELIDVRALSKGKERTDNANGDRRSSRTETLEMKAVLKGEEYVKISNGEVHSGTGANLDANGTVSKRRKKRKSKKKKPEVVLHDNKDTKIINGGLSDTSLIEGLSMQSHVHSGQQMEINEAGSLSGKLSIENVEILKDQNLVVSSLKAFLDYHGVPSIGTHVTRTKNKLLILDVNGLLADIISPPPKDCKSDKNISRRAIFKRPFLDDFLGFCFERFDVGIWSSRTKRILDPVVDYLLGDLKKKLLFLWDISQCTSSYAKTLENKHKCIVFKNLRKIWENSGPNCAWDKGYYDESNTLLLDDSPYKALLNPNHTGIFPLSYSYKDTNDSVLGPDGDLRIYLEGVAATENLKTYIKQHPFGQHAIDETSPHWAFYSGAIKAIRS